eukprot:5601209-Prymnesium_polylepis.1
MFRGGSGLVLLALGGAFASSVDTACLKVFGGHCSGNFFSWCCGYGPLDVRWLTQWTFGSACSATSLLHGFSFRSYQKSECSGSGCTNNGGRSMIGRS